VQRGSGKVRVSHIKLPEERTKNLRGIEYDSSYRVSSKITPDVVAMTGPSLLSPGGISI